MLTHLSWLSSPKMYWLISSNIVFSAWNVPENRWQHPKRKKMCFTARYSKFSMIRVHFSQPFHIQAMLLFYCIIFLHFSLPLLNSFKKPNSFNVSYKMDKFPLLFTNLKSLKRLMGLKWILNDFSTILHALLN